jgi:hypothetical protein
MMKTLVMLGLLLFGFGNTPTEPSIQQNTAKTEIAGAGPCTNFPSRYRRIEERLAWFYGCMHENPPTVEEVKAKISSLPQARRAPLEPYDLPTQEALIGVAFGDLPIQVFPK